MLVSSKKNFVDYSKKYPGLKVLKGKHYTREEILDWATKEYEIEKDFFFEMKKNDFNILKVYSFLPKDMVS